MNILFVGLRPNIKKFKRHQSINCFAVKLKLGKPNIPGLYSGLYCFMLTL